MGLFLFVAAVKSAEPLEIAASIKLSLEQEGYYSNVKKAYIWREEIKNRSHFDIIDPPALTAIFNPKNDFSCVSFDNCPFQESNICKKLSRQLNTAVSLIEVYDSVTWYHKLYKKGELIDIFCNNPEDLEGIEKAGKFKGDADILSNVFGIDKFEIEEYLFQFNSKNRNANNLRKVSDSNTYPLGSEWFFIDFWRKLGIEYPSKSPEIVMLHKFK